MKKLLCKELLFALSIFCCFFIAFSSCSDSEDESIILQLTLDSSQQSKTLFWDETEASVKFSATGPWTATVEDVTSRATDNRHSYTASLSVLPSYHSPKNEKGSGRLCFLSEYTHTTDVYPETGSNNAP
jgi:hypothetical protein